MSKDAEKSVKIERRSDGFEQFVTPATWKKMQDQGKGEFFKEITAPPIPKEVTAKVAQNKLSGKLNPESDQHHDSTTKPAEHLG